MNLFLSFLDGQIEAGLDWAFDRFLDRIEDDSEAHDRLVRVVTDALVDRIEDDPGFANRFLRILNRIDWPIVGPPAPTARLIREEFDNMLVFTAELPPPGAPDVVLRELELVVAGGAPEILDVTAGPVEFRVPEETEFTIRLRETDDVGNVSEWSDPFTDVAHDTIAPPKPGAFGVQLVREEEDGPTDGGTDGGTTAPGDAGTTAPGDAGTIAPDAGGTDGAGGAPPPTGTPGDTGPTPGEAAPDVTG